MTPKFKAGDRVRYIGPLSRWSGRTGKVEGSGSAMTEVTWASGGKGHPDTKNLELIAPAIDVSKPLQYVSGTNVASAPFIAETKEGNIIVGRAFGTGIGSSSAYSIFTREGKHIQSESRGGSALSLRNTPEPEQVHGVVSDGSHTWDVVVTHVDGQAQSVELV